MKLLDKVIQDQRRIVFDRNPDYMQTAVSLPNNGLIPLEIRGSTSWDISYSSKDKCRDCRYAETYFVYDRFRNTIGCELKCTKQGVCEL